MQRILIIGCSGSGKSTFARKLASHTGLPLYYLDLLWHKEDRSTVSREEFDRALDSILERDKWIIDGNFQRTLGHRLEKCDTVFLFDLPVEKCLEGVRKRIGVKRPDMPWIEREFDRDFMNWIINFPQQRLPAIKSMLAQAPCKSIIFRSHEEVDKYLASLNQGQHIL